MSAPQLQVPPGFHPSHNDVSSFDVVIRFSASIPDLLVSVPGDPDPTTATLKRLIRTSLPSNLRDRRIRLIHAGKALEDGALLSASIKRHSPSRTGSPAPNTVADGLATSVKGKEPVRDPSTQPRIYIHCSVGDVVLSSKELADEEALANRHVQSRGSKLESHSDGESQQSAAGLDNSNVTPAPRGFDRLLAAGFSSAEVQNLRLQFMAIQAHTHTPDTMPSPNTLRNMEDRWLDNSNSAEGGAGLALAGRGDDDASVGALDDMLWGAALGFFWPLGCLFWGFREEGIWSQRRKMAVVVGVVLNVGIGLIRYTS